MCCLSGIQQGFQRWGHQNGCFCGCDVPPYLRSRIMTQKQKISELEKHLADLRNEAEAVEARIAQIKKENGH